MWAEIILTRDDLAGILSQALPFSIPLGTAESEHSLTLSDLAEVELVPESGLRVVCRARLHWPLLGIDVPVNVSALTIVLIPVIEKATETDLGDKLVVRATVDPVSFASLPLVADTVTSAINARLATKEAEVSWNFSKTLTALIPLPRELDPLESFAIHPAWGKVSVTKDAAVFAVSVHSALVRRGEVPPPQVVALAQSVAEPAAVSPVAPIAPAHPPPGTMIVSKRLVTGGAWAIAAGLVYLALRRPRHRAFE